MSENIQKEIWREKEGDIFSPNIHVTEEGHIAIAVDNTVIIKSIRDWHQLAKNEIYPKTKASAGCYEPSKFEKIERYLGLLYGAQSAGHAVHDEIDKALKLFRQEAGF